MVRDRVDRGDTDRMAQLGEQLHFLRASCDAFDKGFEIEAKRVAVCLRTLLHDTRKSRSLLFQLDWLHGFSFHSTAADVTTWAPNSSCAALVVLTGEGNGARWLPKCAFPNDGSTVRLLPFDEWWSEWVLLNGSNGRFSRRDLVLEVANTDGGAHVDPSLDAAYHTLISGKATTELWVGPPTTDNPRRMVLITLRQIAHELLETIRANPVVDITS